MKFPQPVVAPKPVFESSKYGAWVLSGLIVLMLLAQLYTLDSFIGLIFSMNLPLLLWKVSMLAPIIIILELFSLPFLLRMTISNLFRWLSLFCLWLTGLVWLFLGVYLSVFGSEVSTVGMFGTVFDVPTGIISLAFCATLALLIVWSSVGLWPGQKVITNNVDGE